MRNTKSMGSMIGFLLIAFIFSGCQRDEVVTYVVKGGYETIDGEYKVEITMVENTCDGELSEPWQDIVDVLVEEEYDDGTYLAFIVISGEVYLPDVKVEPNGDVNFEYFDEWWGANQLLNGTLTPQEADLTLGLEYLDWYGEVECYMTYEMKGYKRYVSAPPTQ